MICSTAARAKQNGIDAQDWVFENLGAFCDNMETIDTQIAGIPTEVKSCMEYIFDQSCTRHRRAGRVVFREPQHQALRSCSGRYLVLVCRERNDFENEPLDVATSFFLPTEAVDHLCPEGFGRKGISWRVLQGGSR